MLQASIKPSQTQDQPGGCDLSEEAILHRGKAVLVAESEAILDALSRMGDGFVHAVREVVTCHGRICVTGVGKAGLIGAKIQATLASTGTLSYCLHPVEALHGDLGMVHSEDVILALSKSGGSELVRLLPLLSKMGCKIILLTANVESLAAKQADFVLDIGATEEACPLRLAPSSSAAAMLAIGDAITLTVMQCKSVKPEQYATYHPGGALGRYLMKNEEVMRKGADCPCVQEGITLSECYEAILKAPHRAGAAAVVDEHHKVVGIITHGDFFRMFKNHEQAADRPVCELMTKDPKRINHKGKVVDALALMREHAIDELPVVDDDNTLVGLIDIQDLVAKGFLGVGG